MQESKNKEERKTKRRQGNCKVCRVNYEVPRSTFRLRSLSISSSFVSQTSSDTCDYRHLLVNGQILPGKGMVTLPRRTYRTNRTERVLYFASKGKFYKYASDLAQCLFYAKPGVGVLVGRNFCSQNIILLLLLYKKIRGEKTR